MHLFSGVAFSLGSNEGTALESSDRSEANQVGEMVPHWTNTLPHVLSTFHTAPDVEQFLKRKVISTLPACTSMITITHRFVRTTTMQGVITTI
jgi:hypothetical protein